MIELGGRDTKKAMIPIYGNADQDKILLNHGQEFQSTRRRRRSF